MWLYLKSLKLISIPLLAFLTIHPLFAQTSIVIASTTSTEQSGLFEFLLPAFEKKTGIIAKAVAVGTGQALDMGRRGDADVVLVHDKQAEEKFLSQGFSRTRYNVMYNDFVLIGPKTDPANIAQSKDTQTVFTRIYNQGATFVSRGDKSGTHAAELRYWNMIAMSPSATKQAWYKETGSGMGPALNTASAMNAYTLADRGTWISFKNRGDLKILFEGDSQLFNQYGVMLVNPDKNPQTKVKEGQMFIDWLISPEGQKIIASYKISGQQLFFPNASQ
ncbi:MAG: substrate-binding domain-containing protein [Betaproteobacteria bacterium]|jgi:tungstate transport system substrate-binding protein